MLRVFIHRPVLSIVISLLITLAGLLSMFRLPISQFPEITPPTVIVSASYPGADAQTVEQSVAAPIEQQVNGAQGMLYLQSKSSNEGVYQLTVTFEVGTNPDLAAVDIQNRVNLATPFLPSDVIRNGVTVKKQSAQVLMFLALNSPDESFDRLYLSNFAAINVVDQLSRVKGVGEVLLAGGRQDYALRIWMNPERLARWSLTPGDLEQALLDQNLQAAAGAVGSQPMPYPVDFQYSVNVKGRLTEVEEFENILVRANRDGSLVRLKDVARVELGAQNYANFGRFQGKPCIPIGIFQLPGANALETAQGVRRTLDELSKTFPPGIACQVNLDTTAFVDVAIREVVKTLGEAFLLVLLVVFVFLGNWRATLIPMLAIPVSLIGTFSFFVALGFSINMLTLFGLILAVGIVVDDAIVVVEAVEHHIECGLAPVAATEKAMEEVSGPVVAMALVLVSVFVPVAFVGGVTGQLYQQFALTLAVSVCISAVVALTLTPALCASLLRPRKEMRGPIGWFLAVFNRAFQALTRGYLWGVRRAIRFGLITLLLLGVFLWWAQHLQRTVPTSFLPNEDNGYCFMAVTLPDAASLQRTDALCAQVEAICAQDPEVATVLTLGGFGLVSGSSGSNQATVVVRFKPWGERPRPEQLSSRIVRRLQAQVGALPQAQIRVVEPPPIRGLGFSGGFTFELQDRAGGGLQELNQVAQEFMGAARQNPQLGTIYTFFSNNVPQLRLEVDRDKVKLLGVPLSEVFRSLQANLGGLFVNQFNRFGRIWRVYLQADPEFRRGPEDIGRLYVRGAGGQMVPLRTLLTYRTVNTVDTINRFNLYRTVEIQGQAAPGVSSGQAIAAMEELARNLPQGYGYEWTGTALQEKLSSGQQGQIFLLALVFVFLFLAAQYESWAIPFSVLLGLPVGVVGAFLAVQAAGLDNNVYVQIGLVLLVGLAAKNAILIVEFAQMRYKQGRGLVEAAVEGAQLRFRPILMTSFAFILGVVPLVTASGAAAVSRQALGNTVFGGMLAASLLGVFFIPTLYVVVQGLADLASGRARLAPETTEVRESPESA